MWCYQPMPSSTIDMELSLLRAIYLWHVLTCNGMMSVAEKGNWLRSWLLWSFHQRSTQSPLMVKALSASACICFSVYAFCGTLFSVSMSLFLLIICWKFGIDPDDVDKNYTRRQSTRPGDKGRPGFFSWNSLKQLFRYVWHLFACGPFAVHFSVIYAWTCVARNLFSPW